MLLLYRAPFSTNVERVALALAHKGLEVESVEISYEDRSPVIEVSGQPLVPVLVDGELVIADSVRILRHLEERHPDPPLFPRDPARAAELDVFLEWFNEVWKVAPNAIEAELEKPQPDHDRIAALGARMRAWLDLFEALLDGRDHLFGDFSAADCAAFPFLKFGKLRDPADDELFHRVLEDKLSIEGSHPRLSSWIDRVNERPRV
ncbi:MAG TPA: glutathione S-transferase family protein [Thermoleophilaceae bacterium]|nr:glutathione S-transferase family protein [Thermoleophilaceae bacterium]